MHVRCCGGDISKRRCFEFTLLSIECRIVKLYFVGFMSCGGAVVVEVETAVAAKAVQGLAEEEHFAMFG